MTSPVPWLDIGLAERPIVGETVSGDRAVVHAFDGGVLVAAIDGLGHGRAACEAADVAAATLQREAHQPLAVVFARAHEALRRTRGAVISVGCFSLARRELTWSGVGNVEAYLLRPGRVRERMLVIGGIIGHVLPTFRVGRVPLEPGDTLVLATDGIRNQFPEAVPGSGDAQAVADRVFECCAKEGDDALVLVARFLGEAR